MIEVIKQQVDLQESHHDKLNVTREFLQTLTLKIINEKNLFQHIVFLGGTCLRIIYQIRRFSEDLDFSLIKQKGYDFKKIYQELSKSFELYGLPFEAKPSTERTVHSMMMKFPGLLKKLGLSPLESQKISIKFEIDANPPKGGQVTDTYISKYFTFNIVHYDLPSLFAGKLHACFYREYVKGRDFYDFVWYLAKRIKPNFILLNNAIIQSQGTDLKINDLNFKNYLIENVRQVDFAKVKIDVERFLEDKNELELFDQPKILSTIENVY